MRHSGHVFPTYALVSLCLAASFPAAAAGIPPGFEREPLSMGVESAVYAESNHFRVGEAITPELIIDCFKGQTMHAEGTLVEGVSVHGAVDVVAAFNAANGDVLDTDVGWTPTLALHGPIETTGSVPVSFVRAAGSFK